MRPLQKLSVFYLLASLAALPAMAQTHVRTTIVEYTVKREDSASSILHSFGIGTPNSPYRIYGQDGFLAKMRRANPDVDFNRLVTGSALKVIVPVASGADAPRMGGNTPTPNTASRSVAHAPSVKTASTSTTPALSKDEAATALTTRQERPATTLAAAQERPAPRNQPQVQTPRNPPPAVPPPPVPPPPVSPLPPGLNPASPQLNTDIAQPNRQSRTPAPVWTPTQTERPVAVPPQAQDYYDQPRQPIKPLAPSELPSPNDTNREPAIPREFPTNTKAVQSYDPSSGKIDEDSYTSSVAPYPKQDPAPAKAWPNPATTVGVFDCSIRLEQAVVNVQAGNAMGIKRELYRVRDNDDIASILYERGVGRPDNFAKLFGERGWIVRNKIYNVGRVDLDNLQPGQKITIIYPVQTKFDPCDAHQANVIATQPSTPTEADQYGKTAATNVAKENANSIAANAPVTTEQTPQPQVEIVSPMVPTRDPKIAKTDPASNEITTETLSPAPPIQPAIPAIQELAKLTPAERDLLDPKTLSQQLDETTLAALDDNTLAAIPDSVIAKKAKEVSALEAIQPGMTKLFKRFHEQIASSYIGLRVGHSLAAKKDALLSKVVSYGLLVEIRQGLASGLRLIADVAPKVTVEVDGFEQHFEYNRVLLGGALEFNGPFWFDLMHITPRIGRYHIAAKTPAGQTFWGEKVSEELNIAKAVSAGLEVDVELAQFFYVMRFWAGRDVVVPVLKNSYKSTSTRAGFDVFIKGRSFEALGTNFTPNYLIFGAFEDILLNGAKDDNARQQLQVNLPTAGLGITFTPH